MPELNSIADGSKAPRTGAPCCVSVHSSGGLAGELAIWAARWRRRLRKLFVHYLSKIARLGGYLARAHDPPPGNMVMWRGMTRLLDIRFGAMIGAALVGN